MNDPALKTFVDTLWDADAIPTLQDYIRIPNISQMFDPDWAEHGHIEKAVRLFEAWAREKIKVLPGATVEIVREKDRTPLLLIEVPGTGAGNVLMYGHLDKQPGVTGWFDWTGPWTPAIKADKLYGRGGADDGYAMFASLISLLALASQRLRYPRATIVIEAGEESGSPDLTHYIDILADRIKVPDLIVALDSGCGDYDRLWLTTSLRGIAAGTLCVKVLTEGLHSGDAGGLVPSSFRILRQLLSRIEDATSGAILLEGCAVEIPAERLEQARACAEIMGNEISKKLPFAGNTRPMATSPVELILNRTWRPQLAVIAIDGYPKPEAAGNVLLPETVAKLSLRLPPSCDADKAVAALKNALERDSPYDAVVTFETEAGQAGWNAPSMPAWLTETLNGASQAYFGHPVAYMGEGGSIPFMAELGRKFPAAQFLISGVLGPKANAHGPNEFLHIPTAKKLTAAVADALTALAESK